MAEYTGQILMLNGCKAYAGPSYQNNGLVAGPLLRKCRDQCKKAARIFHSSRSASDKYMGIIVKTGS